MKAVQNFYLKIILLSVLSGIIVGTVWQTTFFFFLQAIGFVPFFLVLHEIRNTEFSFRKKVGLLVLSIFLCRGVALSIGASWLANVSIGAMILLIGLDIVMVSLFLILLLFKRIPFFTIIPLFILFEYLMQNMLMLSPFYMMGYSWANHIELIQYYSILGVEMGSILIYTLNFIAFSIFIRKKVKKIEWGILAFFAILIGHSLVHFYTTPDLVLDENNKVSIIHTQVQFDKEEYLRDPTILVQEVNDISPENALVVAPEGFFNRFGWLEGLSKSWFIKKVDSINQQTGRTLVAGANLYSVTKEDSPQTRFNEQYNVLYNVNNVSLLLTSPTKVKAKQKFIPFLEYVPNGIIAQKINDLIPIIGYNSKVSPLDRTDIFKYKNMRFDILLCYGSLYPLMAAERAKNSDFLVIQASEYWHNSKKCSDIYFNINKATAIQSGIPIYRSSNYGYTGVILPNGKSESIFRPEGEFNTLISALPKRSTTTFYSQIAGYSYWMSALLLMGAIGYSLIKKQPTKRKK